MTDLSTSVGPVDLVSPLIAASGTVGSIIEFVNITDFSLYGAAVIKSVAPEPWGGRPAPRIAPVGTGLLNGIGIQNPGIERWMDDHADAMSAVPTQVWGSVVAHDETGFGIVARAMGDETFRAIEVNLSCPNLDGRPFALDADVSARVISAVKDSTTLPVGAKLSCDAQPIEAVASAVAEAGADWVVIANTVRGAGIDITTRRPLLSSGTGGYSGSPVRPIALAAIMAVRTELPSLPIVGCGGVSHGDHVAEYLLAGASAVAVGSAHFADAGVAERITRQLKRYCDRHGVGRLTELIGAYEPW
jgi:dihydroorotate dehydrogenase (NAD+) catalytic subunit